MPRISLVLALIVYTVGVLGAQDATRPTILNVIISATGDQLTISGKGFGSAPLVTIDGQPATVLTATDAEVSVVTPAVLLTTTGTFRLTVVDSVRQVGEAFVVASRLEQVPALSLTPNGKTISSGAVTGQGGGTSGAALTPAGTVEISAIENPSATALGYQALASNTTGSSNVAIGSSALRYNSTGSYNTATGTNALLSNTTGVENTANGVNALFVNTTGHRNTAIGVSALVINSTGLENTAIGNRALDSNTTGIANTAIGRNAGHNATTGNHNLFLGSNVQGVAADTNLIRIGLDYDGTTSPPSGQNQTFIAGIRGTAVSGGLPVIIDAAGKLGTAGGSTALSLSDATNTQPYQLRVGNLTGISDYGIGRNPSDGVLDFTATQSTYSGFRFNTPNAGTAFAIANNGVVSILDRTNTQPYQLRLGNVGGADYGLGRNPIDGYLNFSATQGTYSGYRFNTPNAGTALTIANNGNVGVGVTAPTQPIQLASGAYVSTGGVWTNASSRTLKDRIAPLSTAEAIQAVTNLAPVTFVYKAAPSESHVGFIAEDVPDLVATQDRRSLATMDLLAVVTKVVQDQQRQLREQEQRLHEQDTTVADLRARLARLEALPTREQ